MKKILLASFTFAILFIAIYSLNPEWVSFSKLMNLSKTDINIDDLDTVEKPSKPSQEQIQFILQQKIMALQSGQQPASSLLTEEEKQKFIAKAIEELKFAEHYEDRELAVLTLGEYPNKKSYDALLSALDDPEPLVRQQAVMQMMYWPEPKQRVEYILEALYNDDPGVIIMAMDFIDESMQADERFKSQINTLLDNEDEGVRSFAAMLIEQNG